MDLRSTSSAADVPSAVWAAAVEIGAIDTRTGASALGHVHGHFRATQQGLGIRAVLWRDRDPDAGVYRDRLAFEHERHLQHAHEILGDLRGVQRVRAWQEHREFVTAQARHQV